MSAVCVRCLCVYASTLPAPSSALTVLSAVIQSLFAPRRVWTVIHWVVRADGETLAGSSTCEGGGKVPIKKSELKIWGTDSQLWLQRFLLLFTLATRVSCAGWGAGVHCCQQKQTRWHAGKGKILNTPFWQFRKEFLIRSIFSPLVTETTTPESKIFSNLLTILN